MQWIVPERLREKVDGLPEYTYGVNLVTLILRDGTRIPHMRLTWGNEILSLKGQDEIEIDVSQIVDVESEV